MAKKKEQEKIMLSPDEFLKILEDKDNDMITMDDIDEETLNTIKEAAGEKPSKKKKKPKSKKKDEPKEKESVSITFDDDVTLESMTTLMADIESLEDNKITLYFATPGGELRAAEMFIDFLKTTKAEITFVLFDILFSAGMFIVLRANKDVRVLPTAQGMFHTPTISLSTRELLNKGSYAAFLKERTKKYTNDSIAVAKGCGFTNKEIKAIKKGEDVYLTDVQLKAAIDHFRNREVDNNGKI